LGLAKRREGLLDKQNRSRKGIGKNLVERRDQTGSGPGRGMSPRVKKRPAAGGEEDEGGF